MNSHYYDRQTGKLVKRAPVNPDYKAGLDSGRKQRRKDKESGDYPREGRPISRDRGEVWVRAYQSAYYQHRSQGRPMLGDSPTVTISVCVDRGALQQAESAGFSRGDVFAAGINTLCPERLNLTDQKT